MRLRCASGLIAAAALVLALLTIAGPAVAAKPCFRQVLDDWTHNGRVDRKYPVDCIDKALRNLPQDLENYTDAFDEISGARQDALRDRVIQGRTDDPDSSAAPGGNEPDDGGGGPLGKILGFGTGNADSLPLPLLILAVLAALLMAAGAAGLLSRKLQARRAGIAGSPPEDPAP